MGRDNPVTETEKAESDRPDPSEGAIEFDVAPYLARFVSSIPNPTLAVLVVDPAYVPDDVLRALLASNDHGTPKAVLLDNDFMWYSGARFRFKAEYRRSTVHEWAPCASCGLPTSPEALAWIWERDGVCLSCAFNEIRDHRRITPELAAGAKSRSTWPALQEWVLRIVAEQ